MKTLKNFYQLMFSLRDARRLIVSAYLKNGSARSPKISALKSALQTLRSICPKNNHALLNIDSKKTIRLDLSYEIQELEKDIFFLDQGEENFSGFLSRLHPQFLKETRDLINNLKNKKFRTLITDRDGTINNYCGRYASSIQSVYNAVFLTRFAKKLKNAVILTSAPLKNTGLVDISVTPKDLFILAASKGREYLDTQGTRHHFPIKKEKQKKLTALNAQLRALIKKPRYEKFSLIGSGLQFKFGQTTLARQDVTGSVPTTESQNFLKLIQGLVNDLDPHGEFFRIEDTGKDIEIILTHDDNATRQETPKDFDKGDGVDFLNTKAGLGLGKGGVLVCGDTLSDLPMVKACLSYSKDVTALFVTNGNAAFARQARKNYPQALFVTTPDVLVAALNTLGLG